MGAHPAGPRHASINTEDVPAQMPAPGAMHDIAPHVWPAHARRGPDGSLCIAGVDVRDLADAFGTPLMVFDEEDLRQRARAFVSAYASIGAHRVYYAAKAFLSTAVARWVSEEGLGIDVASGGELAVAVRAGVPGDRLLMHGNNKSEWEIEQALDHGVGRIVLDSFEDIARTAFLAERRGIVQPVLVRATVGVEAHTHEFIATAHEDQKFGLSVAAGDVDEAVRRTAKLPSLRFAGLHTHIGSQIFDTAGFEAAAGRLVAVAQRLAKDFDVSVDELNLGGGMGIAYLDADDPMSVAEMATELGKAIDRACRDAGLARPALAFEPGRAIAGPAGVTIYEVGTVKSVVLDQGMSRTYVSVDGGMSDNIRTALYGADYTVTLASRVSKAEPMMSRVVGKHCESGDVIARHAWLPNDLAPGDLLAVAATGAYCRSMASNYNYVPRPAVVGVSGGECRALIRRETIEDLLRTDEGT